MGRKQRQIAKITKDLRNKNVGYSDSKDFADKIKHSDDYRGKRIKDGERFQSKITDKDSKLRLRFLFSCWANFCKVTWGLFIVYLKIRRWDCDSIKMVSFWTILL